MTVAGIGPAETASPHRILAWPRLRLLIGIALWVAVARLPSFLFLASDNDESFFILVGREWNAGNLPYQTLWDIKPPGLFALFAVAERLFGPGILAARALTYVAVLATALLLHRFARNHLARPADAAGRRGTPAWDWLPLAAALVYPAYSMAMYGARSRVELLFAPFVVGGLDLVLTWRRQRRTGLCRPGFARPAGAGLMFGAAIMIKQTAGFEMMLAMAMLATARWGQFRHDFTAASVFAATASLPALGFIAYFAAQGVPFELYSAPLLGAAQRLSGDGVGVGAGLLRVFPLHKPALPLLVGALILLVERRRLPGLCQDRTGPWLLYLWLATALVPVVLTRALYPGYLLPLVPPLLLLALLALRLAGLRAIPLGALILAIALYPYGWVWLRENDVANASPLPVKAAARLAADGLDPAGRLYVFDAEPTLYLLTGTRPLTRYPFPQHLICDFTIPAGSQMAEIDRILATAPTYIVTARNSMICERDDRVRRVARALETQYRLLDTLRSDTQALDLYRRNGD